LIVEEHDFLGPVPLHALWFTLLATVDALSGCVLYKPTSLCPVETDTEIESCLFDAPGFKVFLQANRGAAPAVWDLESLTIAAPCWNPCLHVVWAEWASTRAGETTAAARRQFAVVTFLSKTVRKAYGLKCNFENPDTFKAMDRDTILSIIDKLWQEHLSGMESLRNSIGLRDRLIEYTAEVFKIFAELMVIVKSEIFHDIFRSTSSQMPFENFLRRLSQNTVD
jgi:hypothetical protein